MGTKANRGNKGTVTVGRRRGFKNIQGALSCDRRNTSAILGDLIAEEVGWESESITRIA